MGKRRTVNDLIEEAVKELAHHHNRIHKALQDGGHGETFVQIAGDLLYAETQVEVYSDAKLRLNEGDQTVDILGHWREQEESISAPLNDEDTSTAIRRLATRDAVAKMRPIVISAGMGS